MGKKKIALFYDESTESGKQILESVSIKQGTGTPLC